MVEGNVGGVVAGLDHKVGVRASQEGRLALSSLPVLSVRAIGVVGADALEPVVRLASGVVGSAVAVGIVEESLPRHLLALLEQPIIILVHFVLLAQFLTTLTANSSMSNNKCSANYMPRIYLKRTCILITGKNNLH